MSDIKKLLETANRKCEMNWKVYAFNPAKDNELAEESPVFQCIKKAAEYKREVVEKHPDYIVEIVAESRQKNEGVHFGQPNVDKCYNELMDISFQEMKKRNGKELSDKEFEAFRPMLLKKYPKEVVDYCYMKANESAQKNEEVTKSNYKSIINDLEAVFKKFAGGDLKLEHKKKPNSFDLPLDTCLSVPLKDKAKLEPVKAALKKVIDKYGARKVAHKDDFAYNFGESNRDGIYVGWNWNADRAFLGYAVNPDFDIKALSESAQINETRGYKVLVELGVPDNMNNRDIEDEVERLLRTSNKISVVMDVTAERK